MAIHINNLLPEGVEITEFKTGSELLLAYELEKYTKLMLPEGEKRLSLEGIAIAKELMETEHFRFVVQNGLDVGSGTDVQPLAKNLLPNYFSQNLLRPITVDLKFENNKVVFNANSNHVRNSAFYKNNRSVVYISLIAYIMVKSYAEEKPLPKLIIDHSEYEHKDEEYSELHTLQERGILTKDTLEIKYKAQGTKQLPWEIYVNEQRKNGLMDRKYTPSEKYEYLKKNFEVGDVVLRYTREIKTKGDTLGILTSCYPAVIRDYNDHSVCLEYYRNVETRYTQYKRIKEVVSKVEGLEDLLTPDDYVRSNEKKEILPFSKVGVGTCMYKERVFFIEPVESDGTEQEFEGQKKPVFLDTLDTIYAVFEDRGIEYNKEKFLQTYFYSKGKKPKYHEYK